MKISDLLLLLSFSMNIFPGISRQLWNSPVAPFLGWGSLTRRFLRTQLPTKRPFHVLGIETSCDDTGVAIVRIATPSSTYCWISVGAPTSCCCCCCCLHPIGWSNFHGLRIGWGYSPWISQFIQVRSDGAVVADIILGQSEVHEPNGGISPMVAVVQHARNLPLALRKFGPLLSIHQHHNPPFSG